MAVYDDISDAYDLVYTDVDKKIPFVSNLLKKHQRQHILELGSGSGLFTIPLKEKGFNIEGLEISPQMMAVTQKKSPDLILHQGDMRNFSLEKQFDAILALSSALTLLSNHEEIAQCLQQTFQHLVPGGDFIIELPNHPLEIANSNGTQEVHCNNDRSIVVVIQSQKADELWRECWHIFRASAEGFQHKEVLCDEFLYSPDRLEKQLLETGFKIVDRYGDLLGSAFDEATSWRRVLVCQKP
ncbi:class I SAM-dependent methyltransferase [Oscillatoria sp. HE19RPO]|uniref:class I SAM-dependent DNA methyltransferase n=1 Tax=Oscillatoria sp. HE19RPO TaxID=2954806 RepID=UPI0020C1C325|nr:class I SAM-dependent methyltransferase [Oscillatoria sp. HE19RPO]